MAGLAPGWIDLRLFTFPAESWRLEQVLDFRSS